MKISQCIFDAAYFFKESVLCLMFLNPPGREIFSFFSILSLSSVGTLPKSSLCFFSRPCYKYIFCIFIVLQQLFCMLLWCFYCLPQSIAVQSNLDSNSTHIIHSKPTVDLAGFSFLHVSSGQAKKKSLLLNLSRCRLLALNLKLSYPHIIARY